MFLMNYIRSETKRRSIRQMHYLMGTFLDIEVFDTDENKAKEILGLTFNEVKRIERMLSRFREDSQVYRLNKSAHIQPQVIHEELFQLIELCLKFSKLSCGAFDITIALLSDLWAQAEKVGSLPTKEEIFSLVNNAGHKNIVLNRETRTISFNSPFLKLDFGAVGKGYALDKAVSILRDNKIGKANLDFGGHLYYYNQSDSEKEDCVGIRNPLWPEEVILSLPLENQSISTSAYYERNFRIQGKTYGHLVHPKTGYPVETVMLSVSIVSSSAQIADILSTAVFILGLNEGMQLIDCMEDSEAIIITKNGSRPELHISSGLRDVFLLNYLPNQSRKRRCADLKA